MDHGSHMGGAGAATIPRVEGNRHSGTMVDRRLNNSSHTEESDVYASNAGIVVSLVRMKRMSLQMERAIVLSTVPRSKEQGLGVVPSGCQATCVSYSKRTTTIDKAGPINFSLYINEIGTISCMLLISVS